MELDPEARRVLELAGQARGPNESDKARVEQRLALALGVAATAAGVGVGAGVAHASQHALASKSVMGAWALEHVVIGALLLAGGTTAYVMLATPQPKVAVQVQAPPVVQTPQAVRADDELAPQPSASPVATSTDSATEGLADAPVRAHPRRAITDSLAAELELLHHAQAAWRAHDAQRALALLREHRTHHPRSELGLERDALQALVLCELGRKDEGARIGRGVLKSEPHSPLRASIEESCALK